MAERLRSISYARTQRDTVIKYIINQEKLHNIKSKTFRDEYMEAFIWLWYRV